MSETLEGKRQQDEESQMRVSRKQVLLNAFIESRNEVDKQLLNLSLAALGGILAFRENIPDFLCLKILGTCSIIGFALTIALILFIFDQNSKYILSDLREESDETKYLDKNLKIYDTIAKSIFFVSIALGALMISISFYKGGSSNDKNEIANADKISSGPYSNQTN